MKRALVGLLFLVPIAVLLGGCGPSEEELRQAELAEQQRIEAERIAAEERRQANTAPPKSSSVICSVFEGNVIAVSERFRISLDTDLSDNTDLMVGVSRTYKARGEDGIQVYVVEYLSEKSTVGEWKKVHFVDVSSGKFKQVLNEDLKRIQGAGLQYNILDGSISENVELSFVVPVNQSNSAFGKSNANLKGPMVQQDGNMRIIRWEKPIYLPLQRITSSSQSKTKSLKYRVVKTESYSAWIGGRFVDGAKVHVVPEEWERVEDIAKEVARSKPNRGVVVFFWNTVGDVGLQSAVFGVELFDGKISEILIDQR